MKNSQANKMYARTNKASNDFDDYNTVVKTHILKMAGQVMELQEVASGHIKANGSEMCRNYDELVAGMQAGVEIETIEL